MSLNASVLKFIRYGIKGRDKLMGGLCDRLENGRVHSNPDGELTLRWCVCVLVCVRSYSKEWMTRRCGNSFQTQRPGEQR